MNPIRDLANVTPGTARAGSALVVDVNKKLDELDPTTLKVGGTPVLASADELNRIADVSTRIVAVTTTPITLSAAVHDGKIVTLSKADGITLTLPAATGSGVKFTFVVLTPVTSNGYIIQVANASDIIAGVARTGQDLAGIIVHFAAGATDDTITLNGTTAGGLKGDIVEIVDIAANTWYARVVGTAISSEATSFSAAVS